MKHTISKQQLLFYVADEVSESGRKKIDQHLRRCASCRKEVEELRSMHSFLSEHKPAEDDATLTEMRRAVLRSIRSDKPAVSIMDSLRHFLGFAEGSSLRPALSFVALGCLAFVMGFSLSGEADVETNLFAPIAYDPYGGSSTESDDMSDAQVANVTILSKNDETGAIDFEFEAIFRSRVSGNMKDPAIQSILARALISSQNPGVRLRAVNAFSDASAEQTREIMKKSLISAVLYDDNHGVRLEALKALQAYMPDSAATSAVVHVLTDETNASLKIAAINTLDLSKYVDGKERDQLSAVLKDRSLNDENNYIRIKAKAALQEDLR
jgi:hypothetical protein